MNKNQLIEAVSNKTRLTKIDVEAVLNSAFQIIQQRVNSGDYVTISGFGTFSIFQRQARRGRNPRTGEEMQIPALKMPKFRAGKKFREQISPTVP